MACSAHLVQHVKQGFGLEVDEKAPMCFFLMYSDMKHLLNSQHGARCGAELRTRVNQLAASGASSKLAQKLELADKTDTKKCIWTKIDLCTKEYPTVPCHRPPVKWPRSYNKVKQERTLALHFLNESPDFVEKVHFVVAFKSHFNFTSERSRPGMLQSQSLLQNVEAYPQRRQDSD